MINMQIAISLFMMVLAKIFLFMLYIKCLQQYSIYLTNVSTKILLCFAQYCPCMTATNPVCLPVAGPDGA